MSRGGLRAERFKRGQQLPGRLRATRRILLERAHNERTQRRWQLRVDVVQCLRRFADMRRDQRVRGGVCGKHMRTGQQFIRDHAPGIEIGAVVRVGIAERLLGRHVGRRPE